jgi:hypothetical protein
MTRKFPKFIAIGVINHFKTYAEESPSGTGYHIIIRCDLSKLPENYKEIYDMKPDRHNMECYVAGMTNRYFTYTGKSINDLGIEERTDQLIEFLEKYMKRTPSKQSKTQTGNTTQSQNTNSVPRDGENFKMSDEEIIKKGKAEKNDKFARLFDGDINGYRSQSEADIALCVKIAFYCDAAFDTIDRIFRLSKLMRSKWDEIHGGDTYGNMTVKLAIDRAIENGKFYRPPGRPKTKNKHKIDAPEYLINETINKYGIMDNEKITIAGVALYLNQIGVNAKYNEITRKDEFHGAVYDYKHEHIKNDFPIEIYNALNLFYKNCPKKDVFDFIKRISNKNAYNPV